MQTSDVTAERLQRLAALQAPGGARILSLYLDLDPEANFGTHRSRRSAVTSLMDSAYRAVEGQEGLDHEAHMALRDDVNRARRALDTNLDDGWAEEAHALALFVSGPAQLFEVDKLPRPVPNHVAIDTRPAIARMAETGPVEPWAVLVLDGNDARLLEGCGDRLEEQVAEHTDIQGRAIQGTQVGLHYGRPIGMEELQFVDEVARRLQNIDREKNYARIAVGTTERHYTVLVEALEPHTRDKLIGRFDAGADWENVQSVREKVEPLLQQDETHREAAALAKAAYPGVRGLAATLPALYERRVETLLVEPGVEQPGIVCPRCRWASADERGTCPVDGEEMLSHPNIVEWAVATAIEGDAQVLPIRHHNDLAEHDGIGAVVRF